MLILLPVFGYILLALFWQRLTPAGGVRSILLRAAVIWGAISILSTEALSLVEGVTQSGLSLFWLAVIALLLALHLAGARHGYKLAFPALTWPNDGFEWTLIGGLLFVALATALVALLAPPSTWDSLTYHMSRVAHWAQMRAIRPFATGIEVQNSMAPGAEILMLLTYVLSAGDRLVNLPSWFAGAGAVLGVSLIIRRLGGDRKAQFLAAFIAATTPIVIIEASSTMTDLVVGFWLVCAAVEVLNLQTARLVSTPALFLAISAGLAVVTKPTSAAVLLPLGAVTALVLFRRSGWRRTVLWALAALSIVTLMNAGYVSRSVHLYSSPFGDPRRVSVHVNQIYGVRPWISNLARDVSFQLGTPWGLVNYANQRSVNILHELLGIDPVDERTTAHGQYSVVLSTTREDLVANPVHMILLLVAAAWFLIRYRTLQPALRAYGVFILATWAFYALIFKYTNFGSRLQLPLFLLGAPFIGLFIREVLPVRGITLFSLVLLTSAIPYLLWIQSRPLIGGMTEAPIGSLLTQNRRELYFANGPHLRQPYEAMTDSIQAAGCRSVGVMISGNGAEYPFWALLGAPNAALRLEWIVGDLAPSAAYRASDFKPCAVICERCPTEWTEVRDLPLQGNFDGFRLFLEN